MRIVLLVFICVLILTSCQKIGQNNNINEVETSDTPISNDALQVDGSFKTDILNNVENNIDDIDKSKLFDGIVFNDDSTIEINLNYEDADGTSGHEYNFNEITNIVEKEEDIITLSIDGSIENKVEINSLDFMLNFENLQKLSFSNCNFVNDTKMPLLSNLESIGIYMCNINDLDIIKNNPHITHVAVSYTDVSDITALESFSGLVELSLIGNKVNDLTPLLNLKNLETIDLVDGNYEITSLKPLFGLEKLKVIQISEAVRINIPQSEIDYFGMNPDGIIMVD